MGTKDADANSHRRFSIECDYFFVSRVLNLIVFKKMDHFGPLCLRHNYRQETETKELNKISNYHNTMLFVLKNKIPGVLRI